MVTTAESSAPAATTDPVVRLEDVHKSFGANHVLRGIDLEVRSGEVLTIIGPSGSGKSTLLRCVNLLEPLDSGRIFLEGDEITRKGTDVSAVRQRIGMVFQQFNLFPHLTVMDNLTLATRRIPAPAAGRVGGAGTDAARARRPVRKGRPASAPARPAASSSASRSPAR